MSKRLVIIDGKSVFYRGFYAMPNLSTKDGTPTGGVYGFAVMALEVVKKLKPDYVCVAWDKSKTNIRARLAIYPQYKAGRKPPPPDFYEQIPILRDLLESLGWPLYEADDFEADDLMGAFAKQVGPEVESYLVTSDLDVLQLINPHTHIYTLKKGFSSIELFNEASFTEKYGVDAHQWVDVKALKGDSSDNIPGVAGIGEKTAINLIKEYKTLDGVYENIELQKGSVKVKLEAGKDMAYLSKKLVTLMVDAPVKIDLQKAKLQDGVTPEFVAMLRKLEFRALLRQVEATIPKKELAAAEVVVDAIPSAKEIPFKIDDFPAQMPRVIALSPDRMQLWVSKDEKSYSVIQIAEPGAGVQAPGDQVSLLAGPEASAHLFQGTSEALDALPTSTVEDPQALRKTVGGKRMSDVEVSTGASRASSSRLLPIILTGLPAAAIGVPRWSPVGANVSLDPRREEWESERSLSTEPLATSNQGATLIGHDLKTIFRVFLDQGFDIPKTVAHDTKIGAFLLNSLERSRDLSDLLEQPVNLSDPGDTMAAIWKAYQDQTVQFDQLADITKLARDIEFPSIPLLAKVEHRGIRLDSPYLHDMSAKFAVRIQEFEQKIYEVAGQEFNISSPSQLATILFEKLELPTQGIKKGKTGYSTGASELDKLRLFSPIVDLITQYREYTKLKSTYIDALPKLVDAGGKIHTDFRLDVAATGRLSSANPNLQNIPTRTDIGQAIRGAFVPAEGSVFVSADYSQFELRLAAVLANDQKMIDEFNQDLDIHAATAAEVYGVELAKVTKDQRRNAKTINFGVLYGMSPHGLSIATGMSMQEARDFIQRYFELRAPIKTYMEQVIRDAERDGYVQTMFGRRRPTPDLKSSNFAIREAARRAAINMPIQGTEADLMKMAMLRVEEQLGDLGQQILQIHDSILVECLAANAPKVEKILKTTMESIYKLPVKLKVDTSVGKSWGEL